MIKDMKEGREMITALLVKCDVNRTPKGAPYLSMTLEDKSGQLDAKWWNLSEEQVKQWHPGQVVQAVGDLILHKNARQLRVLKMEELEGEDLTDYVREAPASKEEMKAEVQAILAGMKNERIRNVTAGVLDLAGEAYYLYPAATRNHHAFVGGLAWHTLSMARAAQALLPLYAYLDGDLLLAGILLHDLGKVEELSAPMLAEYTVAGNLVGHISMAVNKIDRVMAALGYEEDEDLTLLKHMVLSHHGRLEYGSPVVPMIPEAEALTLLDNLDARLYMMKSAADQALPGTFGPRNFALDNRMVYHRKGKGEE